MDILGYDGRQPICEPPKYLSCNKNIIVNLEDEVKRLQGNMDVLTDTINLLKKNPDLQKFVELLSKCRNI